MAGEIGERRRLPPLRAALSQQRRGRDRRLGPLARLRPDAGRRHAHALGGGGGRAGPCDRQALEGRRLLAHRRHGRSRHAPPRSIARGVDALRRQRAPDLRRPRPRARGRPGRRRRHRGRHDPHPHRGARGRRLGLLLLPPARHPLPPGRGALLDPRGRPGRGRTPDALHTCRSLADAARRTAAIRSPSAARARVDPTPQQLRFARQFLPMFARALARARARAASQAWRAGHETLRPLARSTGRRRWSAPASSIPGPTPG